MLILFTGFVCIIKMKTIQEILWCLEKFGDVDYELIVWDDHALQHKFFLLVFMIFGAEKAYMSLIYHLEPIR